MGRERFLRCQRIHRSLDFVQFKASRCRYRCEDFGLVKKIQGPIGARPRIAIVTSRKAGNSVRRNALRRMVREIFRRNQWDFPADTDWLIVFYPSSRTAKLEDLRAKILPKMHTLAKRNRH